MNEEKSIIPSTTQSTEHPLHMLDNQADPETKPETVIQKPIRTYESDIALAMANRKTSVATIAIAESERKTASNINTNVPKTKYTRQTIMALLSIILIGGGVIGGYYLYLNSPLAIVGIPQTTIKTSNVIPIDIQKKVWVGASQGNQLAQIIVNESVSQNIPNGKIAEFIPTIENGTTTSRITSSQFIMRMKFDMLDVLKRSLLDKWMIGSYAIDDQKLPFIVLTTDFFQNAFAGMLKWESSMPDDLAKILNYYEKAHENDTTSTTSISSFFNIQGKYSDKIIRNRDVREFTNSRGETLFLYSFISKDTIIIATSEVTLDALIDRIEKQTFVR